MKFEKLNDLTDQELKSLFVVEEFNRLPDTGLIGEIKQYLLSGKDDYTMDEKFNLMEKHLINIVVNKWIKLVDTKEENTPKININIWDDFYDDNFVPAGKIQDTFIYVDELDMSETDKTEYLEFLFNYIKYNMNTDGIKIWMGYYDSKILYPNINVVEHPNFHFTRPEIRLENLTHKRLDEWIQHFNDKNVLYKGNKLHVYSES